VLGEKPKKLCDLCGLRERKGRYVSLSKILPDISAAAGWLNLNPSVVF